MDEKLSKIGKDLEAVAQWQREHEEKDADHFKRIENTISVLPSKKDIESLARRSDVEEVLRVFKAVSTAIKVTEGGGKWVYRAIIAVAAVIVALQVITSGWRVVLHAIISTITPH